MLRIQAALCRSTGSLDMSVFQILLAGNIGQPGAPGTVVLTSWAGLPSLSSTCSTGPPDVGPGRRVSAGMCAGRKAVGSAGAAPHAATVTATALISPTRT